MKALLKLAVGAAIASAVAGAVVNVLMKRRARGRWYPQPLRYFDTPMHYDRGYYRRGRGGDFAEPGETQATPTVLVADEQSVGEGSGDDRVELPADGRIRSFDA